MRDIAEASDTKKQPDGNPSGLSFKYQFQLTQGSGHYP